MLNSNHSFSFYLTNICFILDSKDVTGKLGNRFLNLSELKRLSTSYRGSNSNNSLAFLLNKLPTLNFHNLIME